MINFNYQVGGSLSPHSQSYIPRAADTALYTALKKGEICYILSPHQTGKSSLCIKVSQQLQCRGIACGFIDLSRLAQHNSKPLQWYVDIINALANALGLYPRFELDAWLPKQPEDLPINYLKIFFETILPTSLEKPIVIFIDEVSSVLSLPFKVDDFFTLIQLCHKKFENLTFVLMGVCTIPNWTELEDRNLLTIGRCIELNDFHFSEVRALEKGLIGKVDCPQAILRVIFDWTGGHPLLTQKLCQLVVQEYQAGRHKNSLKVDQLIQQNIIKNWVLNDEPPHLRIIRDRLLSDKQGAQQRLEIYERVLRGDFIWADRNPDKPDYKACTEQLLSGLVVQDKGRLRVRNQIYGSVFNLNWIAMHRRG